MYYKQGSIATCRQQENEDKNRGAKGKMYLQYPLKVISIKIWSMLPLCFGQNCLTRELYDVPVEYKPNHFLRLRTILHTIGRSSKQYLDLYCCKNASYTYIII